MSIIRDLEDPKVKFKLAEFMRKINMRELPIFPHKLQL